MLTPEYLGDASAYLVRLYDDLEDEIIRDIARRIVKTGELTGTAKWQYQQLQHIGALQQDILQKVAEHTGKTDAEIRRVFAEAMDINIRSNAAPLIAHGIAVDVSLSPQQRQILEAMVQRTSGNIQNLTMTTGTTGSQLYYECSNMAYMKVISGAYSPAQAIFEAVKEAGREGATVAYPSRTDKLDVAIRRNVLTSLNQTAGRITEMNAKDLDAEYYETSAHPGARPSHAEWQGQVFKIEGATADYPNFEESTEYGDAGGLCGINCRHSFFLFWPGISERAYSPEKLDEYANHTVEYNGDEYHDYEASQIQRKFERSIRESKRELAAIDAAREAAEDEETAKLLDEHFRSESVVLKEKEARLKDFLQQTGRDAEKDRVRVAPFKDENGRNATWGRSIAQRARYANEGAVKNTGNIESETSMKNIRKVNIENAFRKEGDPIYDILGPISESHPEEMQRILDSAERLGVEHRKGENRMAYSPGLSSGAPGQLIANEGDSLGAWLHEERHMLDDAADGFPGFAGLFDIERRSKMEYNAYKEEIEIAIAYGRQDIVDLLKKQCKEEIEMIGGEWDEKQLE